MVRYCTCDEARIIYQQSGIRDVDYVPKINEPHVYEERCHFCGYRIKKENDE